ncbi:MAG: hypothetical protein ABIK07_06575, partial [Planctomycetota bacterium]
GLTPFRMIQTQSSEPRNQNTKVQFHDKILLYRTAILNSPALSLKHETPPLLSSDSSEATGPEQTARNAALQIIIKRGMILSDTAGET